MFIIIDKNTNKIFQTIDKNYGIQISKNELLQEITDEALINKINSAYEYTLIFNDKGNVTDINITRTIEEHQQEQENNIDTIKTNKINEMNISYQNDIYSTFQSNAFDGKTEETYSCGMVDQSRINGEVTTALTVKAGYSTETLSWKNINQDKCVTWTPDQIIKLGTDLHKFVTDKTDYLEAITVYINKQTIIDTVNAVTWGMEIPS